MDLINSGGISQAIRGMISLFLISISLATAHTTMRIDLRPVQLPRESGESTSSQQVEKWLFEKRAYARSNRRVAIGDAQDHNTGLHQTRINEQLSDVILKKVKDSILSFTLIVPGDSSRHGDPIRKGDSLQTSNTFWKNYYVSERRN